MDSIHFAAVVQAGVGFVICQAYFLHTLGLLKLSTLCLPEYCCWQNQSPFIQQDQYSDCYLLQDNMSEFSVLKRLLQSPNLNLIEHLWDVNYWEIHDQQICFKCVILSCQYELKFFYGKKLNFFYAKCWQKWDNIY